MASDTDRLMRELLKAQERFAKAKAKADQLARPARARRERAVRDALASGVSLRTIASATDLSHMRIAQIRDGK